MRKAFIAVAAFLVNATLMISMAWSPLLLASTLAG